MATRFLTRRSRLPDRIWESTKQSVRRASAPVTKAARRPSILLGLVALLFGAGLYWYFHPELQRYLRMRRM